EAMIGACKIEASEYYREKNEVRNQQGKIETDLIQLTHQIQTMSVNYDQILIALAARVETQESRPHNDNQSNGEPDYISQDCMSERAPPRNVNLCDLDDTGYYPKREDAFVTPVVRHQPYNTQRLQRNLKKSKSKAEEKLRVNLPELYNIVQNLLNIKVNATVGQLLHYLNQRRNLAQVLKRSFIVEPNPPMEDIETNIAQLILNKRTTTAYCYVCIKNNPIVAVLNSDATMSLIFKKMMNKLDLKINKPSTTVVVTTNGTRKRALSKIKNIKLAICNILIPTPFQVIESSEDLLLLGMDWFVKARACLHFAKKVMYLIYGNKTAKVPILTDSGSSIEIENYQSPAIYLANIEELLTREIILENKSLEKGLNKSIDTTHLNMEEQKAALHLLYQKKDLFARDMNDLGQTSAVTYEIDTRSATSIKQPPY
ncbi:42624_t:CDS:2, partial [Gigaspora margarita]